MGLPLILVSPSVILSTETSQGSSQSLDTRQTGGQSPAVTGWFYDFGLVISPPRTLIYSSIKWGSQDLP